MPVLGHPHQPAEHLQVAVGGLQQGELLSSAGVRGLHQPFENAQRTVGQSRAEGVGVGGHTDAQCQLNRNDVQLELLHRYSP